MIDKLKGTCNEQRLIKIIEALEEMGMEIRELYCTPEILVKMKTSRDSIDILSDLSVSLDGADKSWHCFNPAVGKKDPEGTVGYILGIRLIDNSLCRHCGKR